MKLYYAFDCTRTFRTLVLSLACLFLFFSPVSAQVQDLACKRADTIWKMDKKIGLTHQQLVQACRFIEKIKHSNSSEKKIFTQATTKLPCVIQRSPSLKGYLITELPGHSGKIGRGVHKVVKKAIFYTNHPRIVADCDADASGAGEIAVLRKLKNCKGIVPFLGAEERSKKEYSIYLEYFPSGSLKRMVKQGYKFTSDQMLKIAKDTLQGLLGMHAHHLIHRDLHAGNILLRKGCGELFDAVLVDFGKTVDIKHAGDTVVPQACKSRSPPEALLHPFSRLDRYRIDVYALGCDFYYMMWKQPTPWEHIYNVHALGTVAPYFREKLHEKMVESYEKTKERRIGRLLQKKGNNEALTKTEQFQILIFQMMDYEPIRRPRIEYLLKRLSLLLPTNQQVNGQQPTLNVHARPLKKS